MYTVENTTLCLLL